MAGRSGAMRFDLVLRGGRVVDPESGLDGIRDVGVRGDRIVAIEASLSMVPDQEALVIDARGLTVVPGFIDLHSHAQNIASMRMQALDGVTTALELECGAIGVGEELHRARSEGRPINFGFSASWSLARMRVVDGVELSGAFHAHVSHADAGRWTEPIGENGVEEVVDHLHVELDRGALGIGVLLGYAPRTAPAEYVALARAAAGRSAPLFTHARFKNECPPETSVEAVAELIAAAAETNARIHLCHLNSTALRRIGDVKAMLRTARGCGVSISTEVYPYGAGMTYIGAPFLAPESLPLLGLTPDRIQLADTGERPTTWERLEELRVSRPSATAIIHYLDESDPIDRQHLFDAITTEDAAFASDSLAYVLPDGRIAVDWPIPPLAITHPRSIGTFARALGSVARDHRILPFKEVVRRCTLVPAMILDQVAPSMRLKGRLQVGADADIVVLDENLVRDNATYSDPRASSTGIRHVLVNGVPIVADGVVQPALPGRAIRGAMR